MQCQLDGHEFSAVVDDVLKERRPSYSRPREGMMAATVDESLIESTEASVDKCRRLENALSMRALTSDRRIVSDSVDVVLKPGISVWTSKKEKCRTREAP